MELATFSTENLTAEAKQIVVELQHIIAEKESQIRRLEMLASSAVAKPSPASTTTTKATPGPLSYDAYTQSCCTCSYHALPQSCCTCSYHALLSHDG